MFHGQTYLNIRHDFRNVCEFVFWCALIVNFLPEADRFRKLGRAPFYTYLYFVDLLALFALNWRAQLPSLDSEFMGFRRTARHYIRNKRQDFADWRTRHDDLPHD